MGIAILIIVIALLAFWLLRQILAKRYLLSTFDEGNVIVFGLRGRGKDMLFNYVINKRGDPYISNVDYTSGKGYNKLDFSKLDIGNSRRDFVADDLNYYKYPYNDGCDVFISDCGVYFPSYDTNSLNKEYPRVPLFNALSRHLGNCNVHCNIQNLNRLWITFREQADLYVKACGCKCFFKGKLVHLNYRVYDRYAAAMDGVKPFAFGWGIGKEKRMRIAEFQARYGTVKNGSFWFINSGKYNDRAFRDKLLGGKIK